MPVRKLKKSYRNVTGLVYSRKLLRLVQFDSMLERDFILLLDIHPSVLSFAEQPMKIRFLNVDGAEQVYVPDFQICFSGGHFLGRRVRRRWIVETKYRRDLADNWDRIRPKLRAGISEAYKLCSTFHIVTESHLEGPPLANAKFLRRFATASIPVEVLEKLLAKLHAMKVATIGGLKSGVSGTTPEGILETVILMAIAQGVVLADLERPLGPETCIWQGASS
jgi:hypothetical protein